MRDAFAAIERGEGFGDAGDLPLVGVEIGNDRFGGEERTAPTVLASFCSLVFADRSRRTEKVSVFIGLQYSTALVSRT